jgi:membrane dipeptidase
MHVARTLAALVATAPLLLAAQARAEDPPTKAERALHERLIVLDTHLDTPSNFSRPGWDILDRHTFAKDHTQVDYPRMVDGGLDGGFWVIFTDQGPLTGEGFLAARNHAFHRSVEIREMVAKHSKEFELAYTAADAERITKAGKRVVYQSMENSYPLGLDITLMDTFYDLGVRLMGPVHFGDNQFGDSATGQHPWHGLSPLGRQFVERANRLGIVIDASHASDDVLDQMIVQSKTPILLSHSGLKVANPHPRGIDDALLKRLAASGGVIQLYAVDAYIGSLPKAFFDEGDDIEKRWPVETTPANQLGARYEAEQALAAKYSGHADFETYMKLILHAIEVAGIDHVGLGADWDGGGGVNGYNDIDRIPMVTARLKRAGYSDEDVGKIMGGNVLRVLAQAEAYAKSVK